MIQQFQRLSLSTQDFLLSQITDSQLPSQLAGNQKITKIDSIVVTNFKSFNQKYVGPFLNFTCIIGPNGSGKSNILDALMFCFCSETSRHSLLDARQLINRQGKQTFRDLMKENKICSVQVRFILENDNKLIFQRTLDPENNQKYLVNHQQVSKKVYQNLLLRKNINSVTPNYSIWQGQIDRLVLKQPVQLSNLFENLSGSIFYKKQYDELKEQLLSIQQEYDDKMKKVNKLKLQKKNTKILVKNQEQIRKWQNAYSGIMRKIYLLKVLERQSEIEEREKQIDLIRNSEAEKIKEINQLKSHAQQSYSKKNEYQQSLEKLFVQLDTLRKNLNQIDNPTNVLDRQQLKNQQNQLSNLQRKGKQLEEQRLLLVEGIPEIPSSEMVQQYLQIYEKWQQENSALNRETIKKNNELLYVEGMLQTKKQMLTEIQARKQKFYAKQQQSKTKLKQEQQNISEINKSIAILISEENSSKKSLQKHKIQLDKKNQEYNNLLLNIQDLEQIIAEQSSSKKQGELMKHLSTVNNFHGVLENKIKPISNKYQVVFENLFRGISKQLLVQNQKAARQVGDRLKDIGMMKTLVILDNVAANSQSNTRNNEIRKRIGKQAIPAIDCVQLDESLSGFRGYLNNHLYGKVICESLNLAFKIRDSNIEGIKQIYTLDGNIVKQDGTISSHGNPEALKKVYKYSTNKSDVFQDLSKLNKQKLKLEEQIHALSLKCNDENRISAEIRRLDQKKNQLEFKISQFESIHSSAKQPKASNAFYQQIQQLERKRDKLLKAMSELEKMMRKSKLFDDFTHKHNIQSLEAFRNTNNFTQVNNKMKVKTKIMKELASLQSEQKNISTKITAVTKKINKIDAKIMELPQKTDKKDIQKSIKEKENSAFEIKLKIRTLQENLKKQNRNKMFVVSVLPGLEAKLSYAKQKTRQQLSQLAEEYGINFQYPIDNQKLRKDLQFPRKRKITQSDREELAGQLQSEKQKIEQNLNKHNSLLLSFMKPHSSSKNQKNQDGIQRQIDSILEQVDEMKQFKNKKSEELQGIRKDRVLVMTEFIRQLKKNLENSYKILTQIQNGLSGSVDLHIENTEYPFDHGVYYSPTPPTKRFIYDLQQLSGGQKSIASLALQYSLALTTNAPFLILDETDAFLDSSNVGRFLNLIAHSMQGKLDNYFREKDPNDNGHSQTWVIFIKLIPDRREQTKKQQLKSSIFFEAIRVKLQE